MDQTIQGISVWGSPVLRHLSQLPLWGTSHHAEPAAELLGHSWAMAWAEQPANYAGPSAGLIITELIKHKCFWPQCWLVWDLCVVVC